MAKHEKILRRLTATPTPTGIKWDELKTALEGLGYELQNNQGSRRKFVHKTSKDIINLHEPHPQPEVKQYMIRQVVEKLKSLGYA